MKAMAIMISLAALWLTLLIISGTHLQYLSWHGPDVLMPVVGQELLSLAYRHLRLSVIPFGLLLISYMVVLIKMHRLLDAKTDQIAAVSFYNRLLGATISAFFGVGVIWTAIGMESAFAAAVSSFSQGQENSQASPTELLQALIDGGLLLALSTTIFGGICGYLLRMIKIMSLGEKWDRFALQSQDNNRDQIHAQ